MAKARILVVGDHPVLLQTRLLLLKEWDCEPTASRDALSTLSAGSFDVVVIGQSVPGGMALEIVNTAKSLDPAPEIIAIRLPEDRTELGAETHTCDLGESPAWLSQRVAFLLARKKANA